MPLPFYYTIKKGEDLMIYDVLEYGAKADGVTNDAAAVESN